MIGHYTAGRLQVQAYASRRALGEAAAQEAAEALRAVLAVQPTCSVVFAAAPSQNEFLAALCGSDVDFRRVKAFHMDEYIGLPAGAPQGFGAFLRRAVFDRLPFQSVHYIDGGAADPAQEIERYSALLRQDPPDIVFMGIGENAHIAFNDPHVAHFDDQRLMQAVDLDETCRRQQVNDGCFPSLEAVPTQALTLTVPALTAARRVFCMVPGATKADAVGKTVLGEIRETVPATILRLHNHATLYIDRDSGRDVLAVMAANH